MNTARSPLSIVHNQPETHVCELGCCNEPATHEFVGRRSDGGNLFICNRHVGRVQKWVGGTPVHLTPQEAL